ncbi:MAG: sensor histidine kinase [Planctomycetes bacterium]|nr:sensor histidine kinase [Planctomycetota bacterium]MCC7061195.1 sensor histidine kinase [Planctomycetota bacterium]
MSQESLFGFLTSTRLPLVSSLAAVIRWVSLGLAAAALLHAGFCLVAWEEAWWSAEVPWSGALPSLAAAPVFLLAWWYWRNNRLQRAATVLFLALFTLSILAEWPRGAFSPAWYLHPFLALLSTISLGVIPGLSLTLISVVAMLLGGMRTEVDPLAPMAADRWLHITSLASVTLASALAGAIVNRLLFMALLTAESQRRKNFESSRALRHREKLLRHALRVETVGDLAGMVCHQLRNTFQVLHGHVTLAELADDAERVRRLGLIEETLDETRPLLDQLMLMAHPDEGTTSQCDLAAVLSHFHEQARLVLPKSIAVECFGTEEAQFALLNPRALMHVLWNLVINARQAIKGEGRIVMQCGGEKHQVWIEISDSGSGIPKELQERIFDPYFTTKPPGQGTGLGLTAVARFVRSSNGTVQVESEPGKGATFRLRFPRAAAGTVATPTSTPAPGQQSA